MQARPLSLATALAAAALALAPLARASNANPRLQGGPGKPLPWRDPHAPPRRLAAPAGAHLDYLGGQVVGRMQVVQVLWGQGSYEAHVASTATPSLASFYQQLLARSTLTGWLDREYNTVAPPGPGTGQRIGRGAFLAQVTITPSAPGAVVDDAAIRAELQAQIAAGRLPLPSLDAEGHPATYYAVFLPHGTTVTLAGSSSCAPGGFCGYHGTVAASAVPEYYYGVHPDMQAGSGCDVGCGPSASAFETTCSVASHELLETLTDPEVGLAAGEGPPLAWYDLRHGEIGDLCGGQTGTLAACDGQAYAYQLGFSNAQADCIGIAQACAAGEDVAVALRFAAPALPAAAAPPVEAPPAAAVTPVRAAPVAAQVVQLPAAPLPGPTAGAKEDEKAVIIDQSAVDAAGGR